MNRAIMPYSFMISVLRDSLPSLKEYNPDFVYGIERGGVVIAHLISRCLKKPMLQLTNENISNSILGLERILIVDDIWDTGETIKSMHEQYSKFLDIKPYIKYYTLVSKQLETIEEHSYGIYLETNDYISFPWELEEREDFKNLL